MPVFNLVGGPSGVMLNSGLSKKTSNTILVSFYRPKPAWSSENKEVLQSLTSSSLLTDIGITKDISLLQEKLVVFQTTTESARARVMDFKAELTKSKEEKAEIEAMVKGDEEKVAEIRANSSFRDEIKKAQKEGYNLGIGYAFIEFETVVQIKPEPWLVNLELILMDSYPLEHLTKDLPSIEAAIEQEMAVKQATRDNTMDSRTSRCLASNSVFLRTKSQVRKTLVELSDIDQWLFDGGKLLFNIETST
ncbi:hypothetical protein AKJ16_DCAP03623 [Drosera capensis]